MVRLPLLLPLFALGGCIIYDTPGKCPHGDCNDRDGWGDSGWWEDTGAGETDTADTDTDSGAVAADPVFSLDPSEAAAGTTFIASLTVTGDLDLADVQGLEFYGGVDVLASETRATEILLSLSIPADTAPGAADLLVLLPDDQVSFVNDALTILPLGSGGDPATGDGSGSDGSGGSGGSGGTDTGSGSSGSCP